MESPQETFISHLVELRDRLIRALVFVLVIFLGLVNWARDIYTLLAAPMLAALPAGGQMIATDVAGAFFVPMKVTMMVAFLIALPYVLYQAWAFVAPGLYTREEIGPAFVGGERGFILHRHGLRLFHCLPDGLRLH